MTNPIYFSKFVVTEQVFFKTAYSYALVNLKPIISGHVLVVPLRTDVIHLSQLTPKESQDFFNTVQLIQSFIRWHYKADAINIAIQDGPEAGQSVAHLHAHVIPRYKLNNIGDEIYEHIDEWDWDKKKQRYVTEGGRKARKEKENESKVLKPDEQRKPRTHDEMVEEALELSSKLKEFLTKFPEMNEWITK